MDSKPSTQYAEDMRNSLTEMLVDIKQDIANANPPVVQELILAQRALEDARMRLGVALAYEKGLDPWSNKVEAKS